MTTTVEPTLTVGYGIQSRDEFNALPDGTVIHYHSNSNMQYEKRGGRWYSMGAEVPFNVEFFDLDGRNIIESLPTAVASVSFEATAPAVEGDHSATDSAQHVKVQSETLTQYMQRFRTATYGVQQRASVAQRPLDVAMRKLEVPAFDLSIGMKVFHSDYDLLRSLPEHTVVVQGEPGTPDHAVWTVRQGVGLEYRIAGRGAQHNRMMTVVSGDGLEVKPWVAEEPTDESVAEIAEFKRKAWELGTAAKAENGWCGEYEAAMAIAGITERTVQSLNTVDPEGVAALPVGSIVRLTVGEETVLYRRTDSATNPAKTERLSGTVPGDWSSLPVEVVYNPSSGGLMGVPVHSTRELETMIPGVQMGERAGRPTWESVARPDDVTGWGRAGRTDGYINNPRDFSIGTLLFTSFPETVEVPTPRVEPTFDAEF